MLIGCFYHTLSYFVSHLMVVVSLGCICVWSAGVMLLMTSLTAFDRKMSNLVEPSLSCAGTSLTHFLVLLC